MCLGILCGSAIISSHSSNRRSAVAYLSVKTTAVPVNPKKNPMKAFLFILEKLHNEEQIKLVSSGGVAGGI